MKKTRWQKKLELWAGHKALLVLLKWSGRASFDRIDRASRFLGGMVYRLSKRYRVIVERGLTLSFPEKSPVEIERIARDTYAGFLKMILETLKTIHMDDREICQRIALEGSRYIDEALAKGKGVILVTAHFGNWEMAARRLVIAGYRINVVVREADYGPTTDLMTQLRESSGYQVIMRGQAIREGLRCLKRNECLGILPDQNQTKSNLFVNFLGRPASAAEGPALLAARTGAALLPTFSYRQPDNRYKAVVYPPVIAEATDNDRDMVYELTARISHIIEEQVRQYPAHWLWLHDRWATPPPPDGVILP
ncbi:MAG: lysophospholipid acyltransferase family protein [Armatimonadetes bacterium]|nr:lysophospholipid acyltransferase family protein [Armatimonadota bacterium]